MNRHHIGYLPATLLLAAAAGCSFAPIDTGHKTVAPEAVLALQPGVSATEITARFGTLGEHQFSVTRNGHGFVLTSLSVGLDDPGFSCWLILRDRVFWKFIDHPPRNPLSWPVSDESRVDKCIRAEPLTASQMRAGLESAQAALQRARQDAEPNALPGFLLLAPLFVGHGAHMREDYDINKSLTEKYDGNKISLGDSRQTVEAQFGKPKRTVPLSGTRVLRLYGEYIGLRVNPVFKYSWVGVLYHKDRAASVFSHRFLNSRWEDGKDVEE